MSENWDICFLSAVKLLLQLPCPLPHLEHQSVLDVVLQRGTGSSFELAC